MNTPKRMGRPPKDVRLDVTYKIRLTAEQRDKVDRLGGSKWVRAQIDSAPKGKPTRA